MIWLGIHFNTESMTVTIPKEKLRDTFSLVAEWSRKTRADIYKLRSWLGHLFFAAQCSHPARLFVNHMLATI